MLEAFLKREDLKAPLRKLRKRDLRWQFLVPKKSKLEDGETLLAKKIAHSMDLHWGLDVDWVEMDTFYASVPCISFGVDPEAKPTKIFIRTLNLKDLVSDVSAKKRLWAELKAAKFH